MKKTSIIILSVFLLISCNDAKKEDVKKQTIINVDSLKKELISESQKNNDAKVVQLATLILKTDSNNFDAWKCLAESYPSTNQLNKALQAANKALTIKPTGYIYNLKGVIYIYINNNDDSVEYHLKKADELDNNPIYLTKIADYYLNKQQYQKAINIVDFAIKKYPKNLKLYGSKASNLIGLEKWQEAVDCYDIAEKEYKSDELYFGRSIAYANINRMKDALKDMEKAIELSPNNANYYNYRGLAKYNLKDMDGALIDLKKSAEIGDPEGIDNYRKLIEEMKKNKIS